MGSLTRGLSYAKNLINSTALRFMHVFFSNSWDGTGPIRISRGSVVPEELQLEPHSPPSSGSPPAGLWAQPDPSVESPDPETEATHIRPLISLWLDNNRDLLTQCQGTLRSFVRAVTCQEVRNTQWLCITPIYLQNSAN